MGGSRAHAGCSVACRNPNPLLVMQPTSTTLSVQILSRMYGQIQEGLRAAECWPSGVVQVLSAG